MNTLILGKDEVRELLTMKETIAAVEDAYKVYNSGMVVQPPIMSIDVPDNCGELDVKACLSRDNDTISVKTAVGYWNNRKDYNLPTLLASIVLYDAKNGFPICIMDGSLITSFRTGAAGAISSKLLARKNSENIAVIGAGGQARIQALALKEVLNYKTISVWSGSFDEMKAYKQEMEALLPIMVVICKTPEEAIRNADVIITTTPSREALVMANYVKPGTHIVAIGADMEGKQELDPNIFRKSRVVVDSLDQCTHRGESQNPITANVITKDEIHAEIGEILLLKKTGRSNEDEITIFDSTGMGIQDNTVAKMIYDKAMALGMGKMLSLF